MAGKRGRPTRYIRKIADEIIDRISLGESLSSVCRSENFPVKGTVIGWFLADRDGFSDRYARAKEKQAECWADEILEIADDGTNDTYTIVKEGREVELVNHDHINRSRLRIDSRKWLLSKLLPRRYGDKLDLTNDGGKFGDLSNLTREQLDQLRALAVAAAKPR